MQMIKPLPVTCHTKYVGPGSTFVAIKGFKTDGIEFIPEAINRGAKTILLEGHQVTPGLQELCRQQNVTIEVVESTRKELALRSATAYNNPSEKLTLVGITGTKGKTTTTYLVEHILRFSGLNTGLIGSIKNQIATASSPTHDHTIQETASTHTTPESDFLQMFLAQCVAQNVTHVALETSSHALSLHRVWGIHFDVVCFTNLYPDHMDFYESMDHYFHDKIQLFKQIKPNGTLIINSDNEWGIKAFEIACSIPAVTIITLGQKPFTSTNQHHRHVQFSSIDDTSGALALEPDAPGVSKKFITCKALFGDFNAYNLTMAWLTAFKMGVSPERIQQALDAFVGVPGRLQSHHLKNNARAIVDYAHNAASMTEILQLLRKKTTHLIVVFGCGGDRDPSRRATMGAVAAQFADQIILTDDNPRNENRMKIINDILIGIPEQQQSIVTCIPDRARAIEYAAHIAQPQSIVALLGKGHENYYVIADQTMHFNDYEEICKY